MPVADLGPLSYGDPRAPRVVLFHGLTGAPSELRPLATALGREGWRVETPLLPGHGETPEALVSVEPLQLLEFVREFVRAGSPPVVIGGLSMGALLALVAASGRADLEALLLFAPAARMAGASAVFDFAGRVPWPRGTPTLVPKDRPGAGPVKEGRYDRIPLRWSRGLREVRAAARVAAASVSAPVLVAHGLADRTAATAGSIDVASWLTGTSSEVHFLRDAPHLIVLSAAERELFALVQGFLGRHVQAPPVARAKGA